MHPLAGDGTTVLASNDSTHGVLVQNCRSVLTSEPDVRAVVLYVRVDIVSTV